MPHDPFGGTAHEDVLKTGIAVGCNHDHISLTVMGDIGDYKAVPTRAIASFRSSGSIALYANVSKTFLQARSKHPRSSEGKSNPLRRKEVRSRVAE